MPPRGKRKEPYSLSPHADPQGIDYLIVKYLESLEVRGYSPVTIENQGKYLRNFLGWCGERGLNRPQEITRPILERYQRHLYHHRKENGQPLSFRCQGHQLMVVRGLFRWLVRSNHLLYNPASDLDLPKPEKRLPKHILSISEVESIIGKTDITKPIGIRDRAILETFYSTGMRRAELVRLKIFDLDTERETIIIQQGKGKKDRMLPIGERALAWINKYLQEVRPLLVMPPDDSTLFLTMDGVALSSNRLSKMLGDYIKATGIGKKGSCHIFRHTMATLMLEGGADIRFVQQMLGHTKLETTEIYTHVSMKKLREVFLATHPGARLERHVNLAKLEEQEAREKEKEALFTAIIAEEKKKKVSRPGGKTDR